jgi:DNA-binding CsgD family transcriptional regulator
VTTAVREAPHHRNTTCYTNYRCRLPECVARYNANVRARTAAQAAGDWDVLVDARPVRAHVQTLVAAGATPRGIAVQAQVNEKAVRHLLPATHGGRWPRKHRVRKENARRILAVTVADVTPPRIDPTGTIRRIQALIADGWPMIHLAPRLDLSPNYVWQLLKRARTEPGITVAPATARKVSAAYDELSIKQPTRNGVTKRSATGARKHAADRSWPNSRYWADRMDVIDDPDFEPLYGVTKREIVAQDANELMRFSGLDKVAAAQRLGVSKSYIEHAFRDHPQYAVEVAA